jgi:CRP-like cAMP-binding protein/CheY-like chemotaxis protein
MQAYMEKILFIEDQSENGENIRQLLGLSNYRVIVAADGREGMTRAIAERPDLVLCETHSCAIDGYGVIQALQHHPETRGIPVILLTAAEAKDEFRKAMEAGADDFLARPFEGVELLRAVEACLERHRNRLPGVHGVPAMHSSKGSDIPEQSDWRPDEHDTRYYKKRTILYMEGQRASQIWYVISGKVKTYMVHADGKELITSICGPGDCLGCAAAVQGGAYTDNAQVLEETGLVAIPRPEFMHLMSSDPAFMRQLIKWLSRNTRKQESGLLNLAYSSLRKKVANGIVRLYDSSRGEKDGGNYISISRDNLAAIIGSAPESLTRTLSDFKREHLIEIADGRIYLLDEGGLRNMIN